MENTVTRLWTETKKRKNLILNKVHKDQIASQCAMTFLLNLWLPLDLFGVGDKINIQGQLRNFDGTDKGLDLPFLWQPIAFFIIEQWQTEKSLYALLIFRLHLFMPRIFCYFFSVVIHSITTLLSTVALSLSFAFFSICLRDKNSTAKEFRI